MISKITKQYQGVLSQIFDDASKQIPLSDYLPLRDLGLDISDGNYSAKYPNASEFGERGVPFIRASNMRDGTIDDKDMRFISATKHQEITKGHLKSGDILIANRGEIGKTSRVPERHIGSNINAQVVRINGGKKIDSSFLFHYISSPFCQTLIDELTTGTALKQLPVGNLVKLLIPAPEVSVQIVIGGALDSMQRVMNTISEKIRKRSQLKQALATELLSGRKRVSV
jgi:type I restriction enzyme S subunit